ncbi:MAG: penicillin-binding protein [Spirochaetaceae bacterium]
MSDAGPNRLRLKIMFLLIGAVSAVVLFRYGTIMLTVGEEERSRATDVERTERGPILDRNGRILALQTDLDTVTAWTPHIDDAAAVSATLADILGTDAEELRERILSSSGYLVIQRTVTPSQSRRIEAAVEAGELPGVRLEPDVGRSYPEKNLAAHVLGYVGLGNRGLEGIEYTMNDELQPDPGESAFGNQVFLTIDVNVQHELQRIAESTRERHNADATMIVAMEADTGKLLAYVSTPSFDPNRYQGFDAGARRNRPISSVYEPGSVFKIFSVASFLELGGIDADDTFATSGGYVNEAAGFEIRDLGDYGRITTEGILKYSSNVGAAYASETVSAESLYHMIKLFGFGEKTGIALNGEERALLQRPSRWSGRTQQTIAIGQEIGVTALQMITAATTFANDGILLRPQIVDRIVSPDGRTLRTYGRDPVREVLSPRNARIVVDAMRAATENDGTARRIAVDGLDIAAKTGTAEVFDPMLGRYSTERFVASTLAMFPADNPQVILYVVIDNPREGGFYGGRIAAPGAREAIEYMVDYLGIPTRVDDVVEHSGRVRVSRRELPRFDETIPDLTGLPKRSLLPLLAREELTVRMDGSGWVVRQQPPPGTPIEPGMTLRVELE